MRGIAMRYEDLSDYDKGIFWGLGSFIESENRFVFRHMNKYFIDRMNGYTSAAAYEQKNKGKPQHVLKTYDFYYDSFVENGWSERNAGERNVPILDNYKDFLRGYIELHSALKYSRRYAKKDKTIRYRALKLIIYGNKILMESLNNILHEEAGVGRKTVQMLSSNGKTSSIDFTSLEEITRIYDYIDDAPNCESFWDEVSKKLKTPVIFD